MQDNQFSKRVEGKENHQGPLGSPLLPIFAVDEACAAEATDPLASEGPFLKSSEWPTSSELESALIESDPFPTSEDTLRLGGDLPDLFGEFEPPLPRDTLPSPPPVADEPVRMEVPRTQRLP